MTAYMLDTDMCSYIIRERPIQVLERLQQHAMEQIQISVVSYAELLYGVELSSSKKVNRAVIASIVRLGFCMNNFLVLLTLRVRLTGLHS